MFSSMNNKSRLYNLEKLYSIESKDENFIKEVVILFVNTIPFISEVLVKAANEKKWDQVYFLAHKVKATIDLLNIEILQKEIRFVEESAKKEVNVRTLEERINFIHCMIKNVANELREDFFVVKY
jgi:hypothetical protein